MTNKEQLSKEQLKKVSGGTQDEEMYFRRCSDCDFLFDIRTANYTTKTTTDDGSNGYLGSDITTYYECPSCHHYTLTKRNVSDLSCTFPC